MEKKEWWEEGVRFQCQGSGQCCLSRGEYGYVYMTLEDRRRMAKLLKLSTSAFTRKYCDQSQGIWHLKEEKSRAECVFLEGKRCGVYHARPTQCRTWPFWPEVMNAKTWSKEVAAFCPGVGKGPKVPVAEIKRQLDLQSESEKELLRARNK